MARRSTTEIFGTDVEDILGLMFGEVVEGGVSCLLGLLFVCSLFVFVFVVCSLFNLLKNK